MFAIHIENARPQHGAAIHHLIRLWYDLTPDETYELVMPANAIASYIRRFPEGVFVALEKEQVVGYAMTMRTNHTPYERPQSWLDAIGGFSFCNYDPRGEWLYGVDFFIHPNYRRRGIGTRMYRARFNLIKRLNLRGFFAGGMLAGYPKYQRQMSPRVYAEKVARGELQDPTITMQLNRGFRAGGFIENYTSDAPPHNNAMLIVWDNPHYKRMGLAV